jgi:ATP-dependent DNA helicase RecQ
VAATLETLEQPGGASASNTLSRRLQKTLSDVFGIDRLRPGQHEVISSVLAGADTLAIMPTGAGKSLCYQLPGIELGGLILVVSPLISLMKDQSDHLREAGIPATVLNSALSAADERQALEDIATGDARFLFVTPERLANADFVAMLKEMALPRMIVIDEAHCISQWGHDFRPAFVEMIHSAKALGRPPLLALTATATPSVIADILDELDMPDANVFNTGVYRDNLRFGVEQFTNPQEKSARLIEKVKQLAGSGIVYCATVAECEAVHAALVGAEIAAGRYNGKMSGAERTAAQDAFMQDQCRIMVATNAFGMGIDKPDIRFVIHYQMPGSLEAYYQEAGRAGRDGKQADCMLFFELKDKQIQQFFLAGKYPSVESVARTAAALRNISQENNHAAVENPVDQLQKALPDIAKTKLRTALSLMLEVGVASRTRKGAIKFRSDASLDTLDEAASRYAQMSENDHDVLQKMVSYAQSAQCRWRLLLDYFDAHLADARSRRSAKGGKALVALPKAIDELHGDVCCKCDNCVAPPVVTSFERESGKERKRADYDLNPWKSGEAVKVRRYGRGTVELVSGDRVAIRFPDGETRTFVSRFVKRAT